MTLVPLRIVRLPIEHPDAGVLIEAVQGVYRGLYGSPDETPLEPGYFDPPSGAFFVGYADGRPVASGAWRFRPELATELGMVRPAEIKRMHVLPRAQGRGYGRRMLEHLERTAREAGASDLVLETGEPQTAAIGLYASAGYTPIPPFGHYRCAPEVRCFARRISGLMLYDDECGFCTRVAARVHRLGVRVTRAGLGQVDLERYGIPADRARRDMPFVHPDGRVEYAHLAWAAVLETGPRPARLLGRLMRSRVGEPVAAAVYRWVRDHRSLLSRIGTRPGSARR